MREFIVEVLIILEIQECHPNRSIIQRSVAIEGSLSPRFFEKCAVKARVNNNNNQNFRSEEDFFGFPGTCILF